MVLPEDFCWLFARRPNVLDLKLELLDLRRET